MIMIKLFVLLALLSGLQTWGGNALAATAPSLGAASSFAVLGGSTMTNTGATNITGDLGLSPGSSITGFPPGTVSGTIHAADAIAANAQTATTAAFNAITPQACTLDLSGQDLGTVASLAPGVYCFTTSAALTGTLTLNGAGVYIFKIASTLTTASASNIVLSNGADSGNVFWQVGSSATLGTTTAFKGNILALTSITLTTGATVSGRILARTGAVTLDTNTVALPPMPSITIAKTVVVFSDSVNASNPKAIPGAVMTYTLLATNSGAGTIDSGTTVITDPIPANTAFFVNDIGAIGSGPVLFTQGVTSSGLTYVFTALGNLADDVDFSNNNGVTWGYVPTPGVDGCDPLVTHLRINPKGTFAGNAPPNPSFSLNFRVCVK